MQRPQCTTNECQTCAGRQLLLPIVIPTATATLTSYICAKYIVAGHTIGGATPLDASHEISNAFDILQHAHNVCNTIMLYYYYYYLHVAFVCMCHFHLLFSLLLLLSTRIRHIVGAE